MKTKLLLSILLLFFCIQTFAQNYNCFVPGKRQYFINQRNYLRGIRIDSVDANTSDTTYHLFHTPRGPYIANPAFTTSIQDSNGSSWAGKDVIRQADGTFLFENLWGDTIFIKTQSQTGESWTFYRDTSSTYYIATVTLVDTMTAAGYTDSVKTILLTAYSNGAINNSDNINNVQIILSKSHGFVQTCDIYSFPYHAPGGNLETGKDFYTDNLFQYTGPTQSSFVFQQIAFPSPSYAQIYDWNQGEVFEQKTSSSYYLNITPDLYFTDTIETKTVTASGVQYTYNGWAGPLQNGLSSPYNYYKQATSGTIDFSGTELVIDTMLMPEEYRQNNFYYYNPIDTTFCVTSPSYEIQPDPYIVNAVYKNNPYAPVKIETYKTGIGLTVYSENITDGEHNGTIDTGLLFSYKNAQACGSFFSAVHNVQLNITETTVYPNPASTQLIIRLEGAIPNNVAIVMTDILGRTVYNGQLENNNQTIDVHSLANGLYNLSIVNADGSRMNEKVVVNH